MTPHILRYAARNRWNLRSIDEPFALYPYMGYISAWSLYGHSWNCSWRPAINLTSRAITSFEYQGGWDVRWDDAIPGLGVRIFPSGKKSYLLRYRAKGRRRYMTLGRVGADITLAQARDRARKHRVEVRDGGDPLETRRAAARGKTFGDLLMTYLERHVEAQQLKTGAATKRRLERNIPASWKARNADSIAGWEIEALHQRIG